MKNVILFGNGLNLLNGGITWYNLLEKITTGSLITGIPNTLQYETIVLASEYYHYESFVTADGYMLSSADGRQFNVIDKPAEENIKNKIKEEMEGFKSNSIYERISQLKVEHYITTNYDHTLCNLLYTKGFKESISNNTENIYSIRRNFVLQNTEGICKCIWPMHGTIQYPKSIMLGLDHYCGSIGKIDDYIKGKYEYKISGKSVELNGLIHRLKNHECQVPLSWIDLFFTHDIHIIGLGLQYDEIDLWWILNKRQRYVRLYGKDAIINNKIYYYGNIDKGKKTLLERLGVKVYSSPDTSFQDQYNYFIDIISDFCNR